MATNNPNVPADQANAATTSAPNASVTPAQPVQQQAQVSSQSGSNGQAGSPAASQSSSVATKPAAQAPVAVDSNKQLKSESPEGKAQELDKMRAEEQKVGDELDAKNSKSDYFQEVANNDEVVFDQSREEHRAMRNREAEEKKGDPTRDPVAKQEAMDMNTPEPGAKEEAEQINQGNDPDKRDLS